MRLWNNRMHPNGRRQLICACGLIAIAAVSALRVAASSPSGTIVVSIPKDASQQDAFAELHKRSGRLILAEIPQLEHRNPKDLANVDLDTAVSKVTAAYHLHALKTATSLLFVRRFWDPRELPDLPMEEMASIVQGLYELTAPLTPHWVGRGRDYAQRDFYRSLTAQQVQAAQVSKLAFTDLTPQQRDQWRILCNDHCFSTAELDLHKYAELFRNWDGAELKWLRLDDPLREREAMLLHWPADLLGGLAGDSPYQFTAGESSGTGVPAEESIEELPAAERPITACPKPRVDGDEPVTLASIVSAVGEANKVTIVVPEWARMRRYYLFAGGHTGDEVLRAIAQLNGWVIRRAAKDRYVLERPHPAPATDYFDYYRKARAVVPPLVRQMKREDRVAMGAAGDWAMAAAIIAGGGAVGVGANRAASDRADLGFSLATDQMVKLKGGFNPLHLTELQPEWQRRFANLVFERRALRFLQEILPEGQPECWLTFPERGFFQLEGEIGPGKQPMLRFSVPAELDANGKVRYDGWGWAVDSGSPLPN